MMRVRFRLVALALALALSAALAPTATAEVPPPEPPMVYCPDKAEMEGVLGYPLYSAQFARSGCRYSKIDGERVDFSFLPTAKMAELASLRASAQESGFAVQDVPELGAGAFSYVNDYLILAWNDGKPVGQLYELYVPPSRSELALPLANLFVAAIGDPPAPTVPAKDFTLTCPTAKQVGEVLGRTVEFVPQDEQPCAFKDGDEWIGYSTVAVYGSIFEYRDRVKRDVSDDPPMTTAFSYFAGLTPGAFLTVDLSPVSLRWQLQEGVIGQMTASADTDVLRRLALLLTAVQQGNVPGKPGLPSTGD